MKLEDLIIDLMYSWRDANEDQIRKWEDGGDWPEMDALIALRHLTNQSSGRDSQCAFTSDGKAPWNCKYVYDPSFCR